MPSRTMTYASAPGTLSQRRRASPRALVAVDVDALSRDGNLDAVRARMPELEELLRDLGRRLTEATVSSTARRIALSAN